MAENINTRRVSNNIDTLLAKCEVTLDTVLALNAGQQAEAWALKAVREARSARGSFDEGQFQYVMSAFNAATEFRAIARQFIS